MLLRAARVEYLLTLCFGHVPKPFLPTSRAASFGRCYSRTHATVEVNHFFSWGSMPGEISSPPNNLIWWGQKTPTDEQPHSLGIERKKTSKNKN